VRLGIRAADDPLVRDSLRVIDHVIKRELPQGPGWRRYNHDGYGQKQDGTAYDGTGVGRSWPILTGERGHYEIAAGGDPAPFISAMENFANTGGMISEQLWDEDDSPECRMRRGQPTGAAMPLCWSHSEYLSLVRSAHDGVCFDRVDPAYQRYVIKPAPGKHEAWTPRHRLQRIPQGKTLRLILSDEVEVVWSADGWATTNRTAGRQIPTLGLWVLDLPTENNIADSEIEFTFFWPNAQRWEGHNYSVKVDASRGQRVEVHHARAAAEGDYPGKRESRSDRD
jgi:glucoamylase